MGTGGGVGISFTDGGVDDRGGVGASLADLDEVCGSAMISPSTGGGAGGVCTLRRTKEGNTIEVDSAEGRRSISREMWEGPAWGVWLEWEGPDCGACREWEGPDCGVWLER